MNRPHIDNNVSAFLPVENASIAYPSVNNDATWPVPPPKVQDSDAPSAESLEDAEYARAIRESAEMYASGPSYTGSSMSTSDFYGPAQPSGRGFSATSVGSPCIAWASAPHGGPGPADNASTVYPSVNNGATWPVPPPKVPDSDTRSSDPCDDAELAWALRESARMSASGPSYTRSSMSTSNLYGPAQPSGRGFSATSGCSECIALEVAWASAPHGGPGPVDNASTVYPSVNNGATWPVPPPKVRDSDARSAKDFEDAEYERAIIESAKMVASGPSDTGSSMSNMQTFPSFNTPYGPAQPSGSRISAASGGSGYLVGEGETHDAACPARTESSALRMSSDPGFLVPRHGGPGPSVSESPIRPGHGAGVGVEFAGAELLLTGAAASTSTSGYGAGVEVGPSYTLGVAGAGRQPTVDVASTSTSGPALLQGNTGYGAQQLLNMDLIRLDSEPLNEHDGPNKLRPTEGSTPVGWEPFRSSSSDDVLMGQRAAPSAVSLASDHQYINASPSSVQPTASRAFSYTPASTSHSPPAASQSPYSFPPSVGTSLPPNASHSPQVAGLYSLHPPVDGASSHHPAPRLDSDSAPPTEVPTTPFAVAAANPAAFGLDFPFSSSDHATVSTSSLPSSANPVVCSTAQASASTSQLPQDDQQGPVRVELSSQPWVIEECDLTYSDPIGCGSFGRVWKGRWKGTDVAIKILVPDVNLEKAFR
eukprot:gene14001-19935_t